MNRIISVVDLKKYFQVYQKEAGFLGSIKSFVNRKYRNVKAVDGISFEITEGELVGFIGPNGAGKTTTLKVLSGLLFPSSGEINVLGRVPFKREKSFQKNISLVMGQKNQLWWDLPAMDSFILNKEIYEIENKKFKEMVNKLSELLKATDLLTTPVRKLSLGQRMKCELIASLLHSPKVLFLDEPTIGLDVVAQQNMREFIREYNREFKATIILTSHYMADVKELCKRVIIINEGKIMYDGSLHKIAGRFSPHKHLKIDFTKNTISKEFFKGFGKIIQHSENHIEIEIKKARIADSVSKILSQFEITDLTIEEPPIEGIVREIFTSNLKKIN